MRAKILYPFLALIIGLALIYLLAWHLRKERVAINTLQHTEHLKIQTAQTQEKLELLNQRLNRFFESLKSGSPSAMLVFQSAQMLGLEPEQVLQIQRWPQGDIRSQVKSQRKLNSTFKLQVPRAVWKTQESVLVGSLSFPEQPEWLGSEHSAEFTELPRQNQRAQASQLSLGTSDPKRWWALSTGESPREWTFVRLGLEPLIKGLFTALPSSIGYQVTTKEQRLIREAQGTGFQISQSFRFTLGSLDGQVELTNITPSIGWAPHPKDAGILSVSSIFLLLICFGLYKLADSLEREQAAHQLWLRRSTGYQKGLEKVRLTEGLDGALNAALQAICAYTGWPLAHVMIPDQTRQNAQANLWVELEEGQFKNFIEAFESKNFQSGESLMDRVIGYEKIVWIDDISADVSFSKIKVRYDFGIKTAIGIPVVVNQEIVTVLEFYCDQALEWDQEKIDWSMAIVGQVGDLLEAIWAQKAAGHYHHRFASLFAESPEPMAILIGEGLFEHINPAFKKAFGYPEKELSRRSMSQVLGEHEKTISKVMERFELGQEPDSGKTYQGKRKDGGLVSYEWNFHPIVNAEPRAWILSLSKDFDPPVNRKMTVASHLSQGYKLKESLSVESKLRGDYLSALGGQINTPVETMAAMTTQLGALTEGEERDSLVKSLSHWSEFVGRKVSRALELSKVESDSLVLIDQPFDLRRLTEQVIQSYAEPAYNKGLELYSYLNTDVKTKLIGDHKRLATLLSVLIENSVEFTSSGEIKLEVLLLAHTGNKVELRFVLTDTGKGIGEQQAHQIRQMITSAKKGPKSAMQGAIGLTLANGLAKRFGSGLKLESKLGQGTNISFNYCCLSQPENGLEGIGVAQDLSGQQVLMLALHQGYGQMVQKTLTFLGAHVTLARTLLELRRHKGKDFQFDMLVIDSSGQSGTQKQEDLIECKALFGELPLLYLTDSPLAEFNSELWDQGASKCLLKPVKQTDWYQSTMTLAGREQEISPLQLSEPSPSVLVVSDRKEDVQLVVKLFTKMKIKAITAQSLQEALTCFQDAQIDLALVDMSIPGIEGAEMLSKLREVERQTVGYSRPILAMTDSSEPHKKLEAINGGANDSLPKPLDLPYLGTMVKQHLLL